MSENTKSGKRDLTISDVLFGEATDQQRTLSWQLNAASWAPPMTLEDYVGREKTLSETALSANGGTRYWVLTLKDDPDTIVSACEVTAKKVLLADSAGSRIVDSYSIASVFTAPRYRKQGMAGYMLKEVQRLVDRTTECGALYSDIGKIYYTNLGWIDFSSPQLVFSLDHVRDSDLNAILSPSSSSAVSLLVENEVAALCEKDTVALKRKFQRLAEAKDGKTHITFLPTFTQCSWHFARDTYVAKVMAGGREPRHRGAQTLDGASWLYWDHDLREKKLKVQRIVISSSASPDKRATDIKRLLEAALAEARSWGLPKLLMWNPGSETSAAATDIWRESGGKLKLIFEEREDGSIPSLRWKNGDRSREIVWEDNEYFSWC
ncbi:hypothetical protein B0H63DRAFT_467627 [Podospora didyma]|uniref:LYC1 C-terminal domain-containing protein n=1 Tax=Podospora didyma TaxID=330526 RepID=A0AAE0P0S6_9PEZI|nr:hypothetical protein B0H63DRAFT_467627 [Podospora didyma]